MARPLRLEFPGALWHVTSRGNNRHDIFFSDSDRTFFLDLLREVVSRYRWRLYAWVQMTNHYHLFLQTPEPNLSRGMRDLNGDYAQRTNLRNRRCGHLFQHRFKGILVEREPHFLELSRYVVLNPVRAHMVVEPADWRWSSYHETAGLVSPTSWLDTGTLLDYFHPSDIREAHRLYREFVASGVGQNSSPWEHLVASLFLGSETFLEGMKERLSVWKLSKEHPRGQRRPVTSSIDQIQQAVARACETTAEDLTPGQRAESRSIFAWLARSEAIPLGTIASRLGISVSRASRLATRGRRIILQNGLLHSRIRAAWDAE